MPEATPSGTAKNAVVSITRVDPTHAERMPACAGRREGKLVKKSHDKRPMPSSAMWAKRAAKVSTPIIRASTPTSMKMVSQRLRRRMSSLNSVTFTEALAQGMARDIARQREQHQRETRGENRLVAERAVRQVAERHLHDVGGDRRRRLERIEGQVGLHACGNGEDHGLPYGTRNAEDVRRGDAR